MMSESFPETKAGTSEYPRKSPVKKVLFTPSRPAASQFSLAIAIAFSLRSVPMTCFTPPSKAVSMSSKPEPQNGSQTTSFG